MSQPARSRAKLPGPRGGLQRRPRASAAGRIRCWRVRLPLVAGLVALSVAWGCGAGREAAGGDRPLRVDGRTFVMADLPGLIEGAHAGAGLGLQFLRHVERTRLLVHLLDGLSPDPVADYETINRELALYSPTLVQKPQIVALNKLDLPDVQARYADVQRALATDVPRLYAISAATGRGVRELLRAVADRLAELPRPEPPEELFTYRPQAREDTSFVVTREGDGIYRVAGEEIERLAQMTDWANPAALERFERVLRARGISAALEEAGVQLGDTVLIGQIELEWR